MDKCNSDWIIDSTRKGTWIEIRSLKGSTSRIKSHGSKGEQILPSLVMLKVKRNEKGHPKKFKAKVVDDGKFRIRSLDYDAVYVPGI